MRAVVTRVSSASVAIGGQVRDKSNRAFSCCWASVPTTPRKPPSNWRKNLPFAGFSDENGKMNRDLAAVGGALLVVSQFTLYADTKSRRPGFTGAAKPDLAAALYERFMEACRPRVSVEHGEFGADMLVESVNDGPVTIFCLIQRSPFRTLQK